MCCDLWGRKESDMTERLNRTESHRKDYVWRPFLTCVQIQKQSSNAAFACPESKSSSWPSETRCTNFVLYSYYVMCCVMSPVYAYISPNLQYLRM